MVSTVKDDCISGGKRNRRIMRLRNPRPNMIWIVLVVKEVAVIMFHMEEMRGLICIRPRRIK